MRCLGHTSELHPGPDPSPYFLQDQKPLLLNNYILVPKHAPFFGACLGTRNNQCNSNETCFNCSTIAERLIPNARLTRVRLSCCVGASIVDEVGENKVAAVASLGGVRTVVWKQLIAYAISER